MILAMLDGAAIFAAGLLAGRFLPGRKREPKPKPPICGCEHDLAHHEPDGDGGGVKCHGTVRGRETFHAGTTYHSGYERLPCTCKQYTGPRIMDPGYVAREITE